MPKKLSTRFRKFVIVLFRFVDRFTFMVEPVRATALTDRRHYLIVLAQAREVVFLCRYVEQVWYAIVAEVSH